MKGYIAVDTSALRQKPTNSNFIQFRPAFLYYLTFIAFSFVLGLAAVIIGFLHLNTAEEDCPWSPKLPAFLMIFGMVDLALPLVYLLLLRYCTDISDGIETCALIFLGLVAALGNILLTLWGFYLLYSNFHEVSYGPTTNFNYCVQPVYLVSMIISWTSAVAYTLLLLMLTCCSIGFCCSELFDFIKTIRFPIISYNEPKLFV